MLRLEGLKPTKTMWLFCEGKTEKYYFSKLKYTKRINRLNVKIKVSDKKDAKGIIQYAIDYKKYHLNEFETEDLLICIFDRDNNSNQQLEQAVRLAKNEQIKIIFSNPCFEYWILCHYGSFFRNYETKELIKQLNEFLDYSKSDEHLFQKITDKTESAVKNAKHTRKKHIDNEIELISRECNPLTLVFEVIEKIDEFRD